MLFIYVHSFRKPYIFRSIPTIILSTTILNDIYLHFTDVPRIVPDVTVHENTICINGNNVTLTLSWGEPFNNFDPIVNYTVLCFGDIACPPNFITTDNATEVILSLT